MSRLLSKITIGAAALLLTVGVAAAQTAPQAPPAATPKASAPAAAPKAAEPAAAKGQKKATTPWGIACGADADKQNLHGKARKSFTRKCNAEWKKAHPDETAAYQKAHPSGKAK